MPWQPALPYNALICRYNEIATKGRNRSIFEDRLAVSLKRALAPMGRLSVEWSHGRVFFKHLDGHAFTTEDLELIRKTVPQVAGVSSVSPGFLIQPNLEAIEKTVLEFFPAIHDAFMSATPAMEPTYAMRARRANKGFPMTVAELEIYFAEKILPNFQDLRLDLKNANLVVEVEVRHHQAFVSFERIQGPGGLPVGSGGRVLALLSGGIDSPVACYQMMRRGCTVDFITFHSEPYTPPAYITKVAAIARKLNEYQTYGRMVSINLLDAQKEIRDCCRSRYRTVLYRRFMLRLAQYVATVFHDKALVTGDNIGQVASQTLENMSVINQATDMLVLRPLLTFDKLDAIAIAERIGTFDISSEQVPDSCTVFAPDDPATSTILHAILKDEEKLNIPDLLERCIASAVIVNVNSLKETPLAEYKPREEQPQERDDS